MSTIFIDAVARQHQDELRREAAAARAARRAAGRRSRRGRRGGAASAASANGMNDYGAGGARLVRLNHGPVRHGRLHSAWVWLRTAEITTAGVA